MAGEWKPNESKYGRHVEVFVEYIDLDVSEFYNYLLVRGDAPARERRGFAKRVAKAMNDAGVQPLGRRQGHEA